jgi:hypothetical protein
MSCNRHNSRVRHDAACKDPEVQQMLADLQNRWEELSAFDRGEILVNLVSCGCSARGLAELLPCSLSTVLRCMDLADLQIYLTDEQCAAIEMGFSPARFLRQWRPKDRQESHRERQPQFLQQVQETQQ